MLALLVTLLSKLLGCNVKPSHPKSCEALPLILEPTDLLGEHTVQLDQRTASASAIAGALIHQTTVIRAAELEKEPR